jgi:signal transduction histidine kinase
MKIRDTLLIGSGISIILVLVFSLVVYVSFNRVATVSELDIIMYEYLTHREERMVEQWNIKYDVSLEIIEKVEYKELESIKTSYADLKNLFSQITANYDKGGSYELEERLVAQLLVKSHTIIFDSSRIAKEAYDNAIEAQRTANNSMMIAIIVIFAALVGISLHTARRITKPLDKLRKGAEIIGKGNLKHVIDIKSKDEIGELASAFNQMTRDLKASQEQIKTYAEELEQKVQERTKELNVKVNELTGMKTAVLNIMEDMDQTNKELIESQEDLKSSLRELKEMDINKNQFISVAAHELKTPLTSIHGFSQLLQDRKIANNFTRRNKYLKIMDHETKRLAKLVNDMLDLSRIDLGTIKLNQDKTDINKVIGYVKREMSVQIKERGLESKYDVEKGLQKIVTDREKLTEILINLINNAVKYTPKGKITVNVFREGSNVHFTVKDTGIGIAKEYQEKIFERFYQVDSSYTRKAGGTGLGLSLCGELVNMLGGKIWVNSKEGEGSEFHFTLPIKGVPKKYVRGEKRRAEETLKKSEELRKRLKKTGAEK